MVSKDTYSWVQEQLFQDVVKNTGDSAKAWQSYYTILGRLAYYQNLPYYDIGDTPAIARFQDYQFPQSRKGLSVAVTAVCVHIVLANSSLTEDVMRSFSIMRDRDVEKDILTRGMKDKIVHIS
ncbi:hypothetical protein M406DRAFT_331995 [Cryphonectria parasitica EP155]|uniref:Uncharacterized protein n=1 Tax=Cryphonectria parasitica (strain ATCC 38755 / EP155) TaxID=660469 RepID=A0A9P5CMV6_CRYP1|nr:uncharacterized protein M406DRAFT_331995 [Cryphonectria parasitica EP155]KAF3763476.1 hypothetical protein M406DRAFT_331995 [Cryphonectria parasitica EP155]